MALCGHPWAAGLDSKEPVRLRGVLMGRPYGLARAAKDLPGSTLEAGAFSHQRAPVVMWSMRYTLPAMTDSGLDLTMVA